MKKKVFKPKNLRKWIDRRKPFISFVRRNEKYNSLSKEIDIIISNAAKQIGVTTQVDYIEVGGIRATEVGCGEN